MNISTSLNLLREGFRARGLRERGRLRRLMRWGGDRDDLALYHLMQRDNREASSLYQPGRFWEDINRDFRDLIWGGALENLRDEYFNERFAGTPLISSQNYCLAVWLYYQKVREIDTDRFLETVAEPAIGGTTGQVSVSGRPMSLDFIQSVEEAYRIREAWQLAGHAGVPRLIVELGAGYGRLAYVCRKMMPGCSYVILDLPEGLMCATSWLRRSLPGEVVAYDGKASPLTAEGLERQSVWLIGPQRIQDIAADSVDAFVNIYSFAEMPESSVDNYFSHVDRITSGIVYTKQRKVEPASVGKAEMRAEAYPVPARWRELFYRTTSTYEGFFEAAYAVTPGRAAHGH